MEQRSSRPAEHRTNVRGSLPCDGKQSRSCNRDAHLSRNYSVQKNILNPSKMSTDGYLSPYRKSMPSRPVKLEVQPGELPRRRGSVYQSSQEVRRLRILQDKGRSIEPTSGNENFLSFDIVGSSTLCSENGEGRCGQRKKYTQSSPHASLNSSSLNPAQIGPGNSAEFLDLSFRILLEEHPSDNPSVTRRDTVLDDLMGITLSCDDNCTNLPEKMTGKVSTETTKCKVEEISPFQKKVEEVSVSGSNVNGSSKRGKMQTLPKSFSAKVAEVNLQNGEDSAAVRTMPKARFGPFMRMLDPLVKSKSLRNPPLVEVENGCLQTIDPGKFRRVTAETSFSTDAFSTSSGTQKIDCKEPLLESVEEVAILSSPVHLSGSLKIESKDKASSFVFYLNDSDDVYYSKTWRTGSSFDWGYTFHSSKRRTCSTNRGMKDSQKQGSLMIGQMQVSCYLCSEVGSTGSADNYTVLEFVQHDISQARRSSVCEGKNCHVMNTQRQAGNMAECTPSVNNKEMGNSLNPTKTGRQYRQALGVGDNDTSDLHPWAPADLLPHLEVAAIVIQVPFGDKERMKNVNTGDILTKRCLDLQNRLPVCQGKVTHPNNLNPLNMKVITPSGRHGLPSKEGCPSPLLYRWRSGGRCDCGGWDMGCPVTVLAAKSADKSAEFSLKKGHQSVRLDVEGSKDVMPALLIKMSAEGEYSVNFHAQFSVLQVFSISIAVLHLLEYLIPDCRENMPMFHSSSLKLLLEEEVRQLLDAVAEEEKRKVKKGVVRPTPSYCLLDPPFSPIARV